MYIEETTSSDALKAKNTQVCREIPEVSPIHCGLEHSQEMPILHDDARRPVRAPAMNVHNTFCYVGIHV